MFSCVYVLWNWTALLLEIGLGLSKSVFKARKQVCGKVAVPDCRTSNLKTESFYGVSDPLRDLKHVPVIVAALHYHLPAQPCNRVYARF